MKHLSVDIKQMMDQLVLENENEGKWHKLTDLIDSVSRIPGDASSRKYYRIISRSQSYILMWTEPFSKLSERLPFLSVGEHLASFGIDVPKVFYVDPDRGLILLEDLGDVTLLKRLQTVESADVERTLYEKVIDALVRLQVLASQDRNGGKVEAFELCFDYEKLMWEVNFTIENLYVLYLKRTISKQHRLILNDQFGKICNFLAEQPRVLAHRDFHSRNIMTHDNRLVMIDFQDARMGPAQYDLCSLLKDSYYQLEDSQISLLIDYYISKYEVDSGSIVDREKFLEVFDFMSVQRNFKAIGSFASFMNNRGDSTYLKYIGNTFENVRRTLLKYPKFSGLREILFQYYYF